MIFRLQYGVTGGGAQPGSSGTRRDPPWVGRPSSAGPTPAQMGTVETRSEPDLHAGVGGLASFTWTAAPPGVSLVFSHHYN